MMLQKPLGARQGMILVFMAGILWSTIGLGVRLIDDAQAWQILFVRSLSFAAFLGIIIYIMRKQNPFRLAIKTGWLGVVGGLAIVAAYAGGIYSVQVISVGNAMLLFASAPFMAAILGRVLLQETVRSATWVAIMVAILGILVMVGDKIGGTAIYGNLAAIGSAFGFAVFTITLRKGKGNDMMPVVFLSGLFGIVIMAVICLALGLPLVL